MSDEDRNKALLRRFYEELWSQGNLEAIPELIAEDFVDHHPLPGVPPGREGPAALVTTWRTAFPDMRETCEDLIAEGDKVVGRFTMRGTHSDCRVLVRRASAGAYTAAWGSPGLRRKRQCRDER